VAVEAFLQFADLLPEAMLLVGSDGTVVAANKAVARLGLSPASVAGRSLADAVADPPEAVQQYRRSRAGAKARCTARAPPTHPRSFCSD
jgi:PAS domain S-box-containing protein